MAEQQAPLPPPAYSTLPPEFQQQQIVLPPGFIPLPAGLLPPGFLPPGFPVGPNGLPLGMPPPIMNSMTGEIIFPMVPNMPVGPNGLPIGMPPPGEPIPQGMPPPGGVPMGGFPYPPPGFFPGMQPPPGGAPMGFDPNMPPNQPHQAQPMGVPGGVSNAPIQLTKTDPPQVSLDRIERSSGASKSEIGWGHIPPVSPNNRHAALIINTLQSHTHQLSPERLNWLYYWTGANLLDENPNAPDISVQVMKFNARLNFLKDSWSDEHFRPFETIGSAEGMISSHQRVYVMRLSTSTPGCITITRWNDSYRQPSHKRFEIDSHSRLVGDNQVYVNIADFSRSFGAAIKPKPH